MKSLLKILFIIVLCDNLLNAEIHYNLKENNILTAQEKLFLEKKPSINIAVFENWENFSYKDKNGKFIGYHIDLIKIINKNLKTNFEIQGFSSWSEAYTSAKNTKVDGIMGLYWSKEREKDFIYSPSYYNSPTYLIARQNDNSVNNINDIKDKTVVSIKDALILKLLKTYYPSTKVILVKTLKQRYEKVQNKEADVFFVNNVNNQDLKKYKLKIFYTLYLKAGEFSLGTSINNKVLAGIFKKGVDSLSQEQKDSLRNKWLENTNNSIFSKEELIYIKKTPPLKVGVEQWPPFIFSEDGNKVQGIVADLLKKIGNISGLKFNYILGDWPWILNKFKKQELDILPATAFLKERTRYGLYTPSYLTNLSALFVKKSNSTIKSFKDLNFKTLSMIRGYASIEKIKKKFPNIKIKEVSSLDESIQLLLNNEVDAFYGFELNGNYILKKSLITSIKTIFQNDIQKEDVRIFSRKDDYVLNSILKKSLSAISLKEKEAIFENWIKEKKQTKEVNIILGQNGEPYSFENSFLTGIEYDLLEFILKKMNISINKERISSMENIYKEFKNNKEFDIAFSLKKRNNDFYYSDNFITFDDTAITRYKDNIVIKDISALKNKKILSFNLATKHLGYEFFNAVTNNEQYKEYKSQRKQVKDFLNSESSVLIIDRNIFKWQLRELSSKSISEYKFDDIFSEKNTLYVAFKNKKLRDIFNTKLREIKDSGKYQEIINNYTRYDIKSKKKLSLFLSAILGKSIALNNIKEIKEISRIFLALGYIDKLEVFNEKGKIIFTSKNNEKKFFLEGKSFYNAFFKPIEVGFIRIYFDEKKLKEKVSNNVLIPEIGKFKHLNIFPQIKKIYQRFDYLTQQLSFTKKELEYIKNKPIVTYAETNWEPFAFLDKDNNDEGIIAEYKKIIENKTNLRFKHIKSINHDNWGNVVKAFKDKELDILLSYNPFELNPTRGLVSNAYETFKYVIVTKKDTAFVDNISDLNNKTIALRKNFSIKRFIEKSYPNIKTLEAKNEEDVFKLISSKKAYATIEHYAIASYKINTIYKDLKIAGVLEKKYSHHLLVQENNPILLSILNKVIKSITLDQKNKIRNKWIHSSKKTITDYTLVYQLLAVFVLILIIIFFFMRKLNKAKNLIEAEKKNLETLFMDIQDAVILAKDGRYINVNNSLLKLFNIKNKKDFLDQVPGSMAPKYQANGELSHNEMHKFLDIAYKKGNIRFQWQSRRTSGEILWIEFVVSKVKYFNEDILHMLCRDITKTKLLELELKEQKNIFETLFNDSADGVALIKDGLLVDCNNAVLSMFGFKNKSELVSLSFSDISPLYQENNKKSSKEAKLKMIDSVRYGSNRFEWIHKKVSGEIFWAEIVLSHIKINNENIIHVVLRNISATKRLQEQIKNRTNDLEYSNKELENSNEELQKTILNLKQTQEQLVASEKMASLGGLVAGVAHEINTPVGIGLTGISHLEVLTETINKQYNKDIMTQNDFEEYLLTSKDLSNLIHKNLQKAASLVRSFKQVAVDQSSEEKRVFNLKEYMDEILQSIHSVTKKADIQIDVLCEKDIVINSYAGEYSQIMTNLIMNSIVHAFKKKEKGKIIISITQNNDELIIVYTDNGKGIKKENLHKIFDPFFTTNRNNGGSGLGLNIIYNIITSRFKGNITCKSTENEGAEFFIHLKV